MAFRYCVLIFIFAGLLIPGCADQQGKYIKDGKEYGATGGSFSGRWWNYYERGRSFADGGFYQEAISDLQKAVEGRDQDQWRARTYGMHFMDYFPHRELGVVYYQRREYDLAIAELEGSVLSAPSAKGYYFLNKARGAKILREGTDKGPPKLAVEGKSGAIMTNAFTHVISGVAEDESFIASISAGDIRVPIDLALKRQLFTMELPLAEGTNEFRIAAADLTGKTAGLDLEIISDRSGPVIEILRVEQQNGQEVVQGVVSDEHGVKSLVINNRPWKITGASNAYNFKVVKPDGGMTVVAADEAGNITRAELSGEDLEIDSLLNPQLAQASVNSSYPWSRVVSDAGSPLAVTPAPPEDTEPPYVKLEDLNAIQETFDEYVLLEGMAADQSPIHSISINGEPVSGKNGKKLYFSKLRKLVEGDNEFLIVVVDSFGNRVEKKVVITRKVQNIRQIGARMSVAVLPFEQKGEVSLAGDLIHDQLIDSFLEQKRFNVVERKKIDAVLRELKLSSSELVDPDRAVELGKIVAANAMLAGTVVESPDSVEIIGRIIDTETATVLASNDIFGEDKSFSGLGDLLDGLAFKFKRDFPIFEGILIEVRGGDEVLIDIGAEKQVRPNQRLICYREGMEIKHPVTGRILGAEPEILGDLSVSEVFEGFSKASLEKQVGDVKVYDRVIAR